MFDRLAHLATTSGRRVFALAILFVVAAALVGGGVAKHLSNGGFDDPASAAARGGQLLHDRFATGDANLVLLARAPGSVDAAAARRDGTALTQRLTAQPGLTRVTSYWTTPVPALRSTDGREALVLAHVNGDDDTAMKTVERLRPAFTGASGSLAVRVGGQYAVFHDVNTRIRSDLARAEMIVFPITFVLLVLVFGGLVAAALPLAVGGLSVLGTFLALRVVAMLTPVSIFSLNLTTGLGLGLAIDYSLFIITRYREELHAGADVETAVGIAVRTAGRTVVFSAVTVALALAALLVFPLYFLRSFAYAGIAVVVLAALGSVVLLPAMLGALGHRIDRLRLWRPRTRGDGQGFWHRLALAVMRRPVPVVTAVLAILFTLGAPFLSARFGLVDDRVLPKAASSHVVAQEMRTAFDARSTDALQVVLPAATTAQRPAIASYAALLSKVRGVDHVEAATGTYRDGHAAAVTGDLRRFLPKDRTVGSWLAVVPSVDPYSNAGKTLVHEVRAVPTSLATPLVTGAGADFVDTEHSLGAHLPIALALIAIATLVVLFLFTGSVVLPVKAVVMNLLSLSATFGAMVFVFQEGHLRSLLGGFIVTGRLDTTTPILMFCVAFGLSMDYEVFLLSRIKEQYAVTGDNTLAVATGLERTGRLISAAAILIAVVFTSFASSGITFIKLFGIGMALAVLVDATLVRGLLVPAFMRLAGRWNWWAPQPLRRLHDRIGLAEPAVESSLPEQPAPAPRSRARQKSPA